MDEQSYGTPAAGNFPPTPITTDPGTNSQVVDMHRPMNNPHDGVLSGAHRGMCGGYGYPLYSPYFVPLGYRSEEKKHKKKKKK